jgi:DNA polymerase-3 subunit gamma/tau
LLLVKSIKNVQDLLPLSAEEMNQLKLEGEKASSEDFLRYLLALQQGEQGLRFSSHPRIYFETQLVKLCHFKKLIPLKDIIQELEKMKKETERLDFAELETEANSRQTPDIVDNQNNALLSEKKFEGESKREKELEFALKDPTIQSFINTFKAQILSVEPIKKTKDQE